MLRCIFVLFIFLTQVTQAQTITDHIRTDGKSINVGRSTSRWQPLLDAADNSNVKVTRDLKYGPDKKQGFDLSGTVSQGIVNSFRMIDD